LDTLGDGALGANSCIDASAHRMRAAMMLHV
jgi:hypothetical protein